MNNSLVKEAENIINEYIRENRYTILPDRRRKAKARLSGGKVLLTSAVSILLLGAAAFLIFIVLRLI